MDNYCEDCGGNAEVLWDDDTWTCQSCAERRQKRECFRIMKEEQDREHAEFLKLRLERGSVNPKLIQ